MVGRVTDCQNRHQIEVVGQAEDGVDLFFILQYLPQPDRAKAESLAGEKHVFDAGAGGLVVFGFVVHVCLVKVDGDHCRSRLEDMTVAGLFGEQIAGLFVFNDNEPPRLVVEAGWSPDSCPDNFVEEVRFDVLIRNELFSGLH